AHPLTVETRAVLAPQVLERRTESLDQDPGMASRDARGIQADRGSLVASQQVLAGRQGEDPITPDEAREPSRCGAQPPLRRVARLPTKGVAEAVDRPDEPRSPRVVLERSADLVHRLVQPRLRDEDRGPDDVADLGAGESPGA